jgi:hypothetical protein
MISLVTRTVYTTQHPIQLIHVHVYASTHTIQVAFMYRKETNSRNRAVASGERGWG